MKEPARLLFVYGTLRSDLGDPAHRMLVNHVDRVGFGTTPGVLLDLGTHPGLVERVPTPAAAARGTGAGKGRKGAARAKSSAISEAPSDTPAPSGVVRGEVYRLLDPEHLTLVDAYEGREFERIARPVLIEGQGEVQAWVYVFRGEIPSKTKVLPAGEWAGKSK